MTCGPIRGGKRPGAGRPADAGERRTVAVQTRLTHDERDAWEAAAEAEGASLADWLRDVGNAAARRQK